MSDDTIRLVTIGRIIRRRRRFLTLLVLVGALVGYGTSLVFPPRYTTSASVLLPGAWEERELLTQAEIATSSVVLDRAAATLGWSGVGGRELRDQVSATSADGNIIKISGTVSTPERAQRLSDQVAQQFVTFAARIVGDNTDPDTAEQPEALRQLVVQTSRRITELADAADPGQTVESVQTRTELAKLRTALQKAVAKLDEVDPTAGKTNLVVMGPAARPTGEAPPTRTQLIVGGAVLFFLLAVIGHLAAARMSRRLRTEPEIAAALGSTPLGTVDVPAERTGQRPEGGDPRARIHAAAGRRRPVGPADPAGVRRRGHGEIRYRRVCARLRERLPDARRLLVVVPEGDEIAHRAAGQLVTEARSDPSLRVVGVSVSQPLVPDRDDESGALVVLSAGELDRWGTRGHRRGVYGRPSRGRRHRPGQARSGPVRHRLPPMLAEPPRRLLAIGDDTRGASR